MMHKNLEVMLSFAGASGNKDALYRLGEIYAKGEGVKRDVGKEREFFQKAGQKRRAVLACKEFVCKV